MGLGFCTPTTLLGLLDVVLLLENVLGQALRRELHFAFQRCVDTDLGLNLQRSGHCCRLLLTRCCLHNTTNHYCTTIDVSNNIYFYIDPFQLL